MTPARAPLIERTVECMKGAKKAIIHFYNATSPVWREVVFNNSKEETIALAVDHVKLLRRLTDEVTRTHGTKFILNYCAETFSQTEPDFAVEICNAVFEAWGKAGYGEDRIIFNLPATVEIAPPNHYADQACFPILAVGAGCLTCTFRLSIFLIESPNGRKSLLVFIRITIEVCLYAYYYPNGDSFNAKCRYRRRCY